MTSVMEHPVAERPRSGLPALLISALLLLQPLGLTPPAHAASALLESVKQNPALARKLCDQFKQRNAAGQSAMAKESIAEVAASQGLSSLDAEVLTTYVIGLYCPDVR